MILFGIIPGPREPSLTMNTYLSPVVSDLVQLWQGVQLKQPGTDSTATFKCALLGVACDLPAARKVCGFLSFSANLDVPGVMKGFHMDLDETVMIILTGSNGKCETTAVTVLM